MRSSTSPLNRIGTRLGMPERNLLRFRRRFGRRPNRSHPRSNRRPLLRGRRTFPSEVSRPDREQDSLVSGPGNIF